ncbi:MAG: sigma-54 dependent transcriptional regulator [Polyangiaceae bacterium]
MIESALPSLHDSFDENEPDTSVRDVRSTMRPTSRGKIIGNHPSVRNVLNVIERVAGSACTVLITGESGTGKELVVAALHDASPRSEMPLITINCGAIPENLIESELFGHAKGSFTGAIAARRGHVASAEGGTLFLDEVGELPMNVQVKLLRLLQQREYTPVGESKSLKCNIRIVAATNRNLEAEVAAGRFREDLYYRLNVIHVELPSLRERPADIALLANHFLKMCAERAGREDIQGFSVGAVHTLCEYAWPGNVRELENIVERAVLLSIGPMISSSDLPQKIRTGSARPSAPILAAAPVAAAPMASEKDVEAVSGVMPVAARVQALPNDGINLRGAMEEFENNLIRQALERTGWNKNRAAQLLGINRTTLVEMVKRKGIAA